MYARKEMVRAAGTADDTADGGPAVLHRFKVVYRRQEQPGQVCGANIAAVDAKAARRTAERRFAGNQIVSISRQGPDIRAEDFPNARFIHGRFRSAVAADETVLLEICD